MRGHCLLQTGFINSPVGWAPSFDETLRISLRTGKSAVCYILNMYSANRPSRLDFIELKYHVCYRAIICLREGGVMLLWRRRRSGMMCVLYTLKELPTHAELSSPLPPPRLSSNQLFPSVFQLTTFDF